MQSDLFIYFFKRRKFKQFLCRGKKHESLLVPRKKGKTPRRARGEESSSPVSEEIKVKNGAHWKTCLLKSTLTDRVPVHNLHRPSSLYICLPVSFRHQKRKRRRERKKRESPAVRSFFFLSTSLVSCRSFSLSENSKVSFHKKLLLRGAAQERRVGRHRPHSKKNQNKILTDADQSSLPPSSPLSPSHLSLSLSPSLSLCLTHTHMHTYWIKMGLVSRYAMPTQLTLQKNIPL